MNKKVQSIIKKVSQLSEEDKKKVISLSDISKNNSKQLKKGGQSEMKSYKIRATLMALRSSLIQ